MSTMKVTALRNEAASVDNIVLNSDGSVGGALGTALAAKAALASPTFTGSTSFEVTSDDTVPPAINLQKKRGSSIVLNNDIVGQILFRGWNGSGYNNMAAIRVDVDGTPGATNDMPGRMSFYTTADANGSPAERMRITNSGEMWINTTSQLGSGGHQQILIGGTGTIYRRGSGSFACDFQNASAVRVGYIDVGASATTYSTTSDYRLKENVEPLTGALARIAALKPSRFNFVAEPDRIYDGFIAHEAAEVVSEAVTGEKDATDEDGNPLYQGIDLSKIVPLLVAAVQEQAAQIADLTYRLSALESA